MDLRQLLDKQSNQEDIQVTDQEIISLAQEAGLVSQNYKPTKPEWPVIKEILHFASLVANAERERLADQIDRMPFGDTAASFSIWIREQR